LNDDYTLLWYGVGNYTINFLERRIWLDRHITAFIDNDATKQESLFRKKPVIKPKNLNAYTYDYIVIGSLQYFREMKESLLDLVEENKIISVRELSGKLISEIYENKRLPSNIWLEASTLCQLNCKSCYMRLGDYGTMGKGYLKFDNFKKLIDTSPYVEQIELSNSGEIFLNPDLKKIIEYAHIKNVGLSAYNGCNFNDVSDDILECLVDNEFIGLTVSVDGATQSAYSAYRRNGNIEKVFKNLQKLISIKTKKKSQYPRIIWQYIIMESSEADITEAKKKAENLGIPIYFKLTWDQSYVPKNPEMIKRETGLNCITVKEYSEQYENSYNSSCRELFEYPAINWDGRLLGCCRVYDDDFGVNVFEIGLENALKSYKYKLAQKYLMGDVEISEKEDHIPCLHCSELHFIKDKNTKGIKAIVGEE